MPPSEYGLSDLNEISVAELIDDILFEGISNLDELHSFFDFSPKDEHDELEALNRIQFSKLKAGLAELFRASKPSTLQKTTEEPLFEDQRKIAYTEFQKLHQKYGAPHGAKDVRFHNDIMHTYFKDIHDDPNKPYKPKNLGRYLNDLKEIVGNDLKTPDNKPTNRGYSHSANLLKAMAHFRTHMGDIDVQDSDVYHYLASKVPYAADISDEQKQYLVGDYIVFRMAYNETNHINISNLAIREDEEGSLIAINNRTNSTETLKYQSRGMVLRTADRTVNIWSVAESMKRRSRFDKFYETMCLRIKWENHSRSAPYINGLYQGLVTEDKHPFSTRVFLLKLPAKTSLHFKEIKMSVPANVFNSKKLEDVFNDPTVLTKKYPIDGYKRKWLHELHRLNTEVLSNFEDSDHHGNLNIEKVFLRITNRIDSNYHALRHYHHLAIDKEFAPKKG